MTIIEMHTAVDLGLQRIGSNALENFYSEEIDAYLNDAVNKYIKAQVDEIRKGGESHVIAHENLNTIVKYTNLTLVGHPLAGGNVTGPTPRDFHIFLAANLKESVTNNQFRAEYVTPTEFLRHQPTGSDVPIFRHLPVTMIEGAFVALAGSNVVNALGEIFLIYIRKPATILRDDTVPANNVSCDLPAHTHQEIVDLTVALMVEDLYQAGPMRSDPKPKKRGE